MSPSKALQHKSLSLSFSGAGHLLTYHLGVSFSILQRIYQNEVTKKVSSKSNRNKHHPYESLPILPIKSVSGSSSGAIAAVIFAKIPHRIEEFAARFIERRGKALEILSSMLHDEERHWTSTCGENDIINDHDSSLNNSDTTRLNASSMLDQRIVKVPPNLYIAVTRCTDGLPHLFRFSNNRMFSTISSSWNTDGILEAVRASCTIPASFHPIDLFPGLFNQSVQYPDIEGISIDGSSYVDGGIASPAPILPTVNTNGSKTVIISPISFAGTSSNIYRISPNDDSWGLLPFQNITCLYNFKVKPSIQNARALRVASGATTSEELQEWYDRGVADAKEKLYLFR